MKDSSVYSACLDGVLRTYDLRAGEVVEDQVGVPIGSVSLSFDQKALALVCLDDSLRLFSLSQGLLSKYSQHQCHQHKTTAKFTWDDNHLITGSENGTLYVYNVLKSQAVRTLPLAKSTLSCLDISPDREHMVVSSHDGSLHFLSNK